MSLHKNKHSVPDESRTRDPSIPESNILPTEPLCSWYTFWCQYNEPGSLLLTKYPLASSGNAADQKCPSTFFIGGGGGGGGGVVGWAGLDEDQDVC